MGTVGPVTTGIWREGLHLYLWERRFGDDLVTINQAELADKLSVTRATMNRTIKKMIEEDRLAEAGDQTYRVYDPSLLVDAG